jgi:two-component system sensor histidine kinase KdpD
VAVRLEDLVDEAVRWVGPAARRQGTPLELALGIEGERVVRVDFDLTVRLLVNLLENALRFSPPGAPVRLVGEPAQQGLSLCVLDRGPGVPPEWRQRIFERFAQVSGQTARSTRGLGLAFSQLVARAQGLGLFVEDAPGGGSRFVLSFPVAALASPHG